MATYEERQKAMREHYEKCVTNRFTRLVKQFREDGWDKVRIFKAICNEYNVVDESIELAILAEVLFQSS